MALDGISVVCEMPSNCARNHIKALEKYTKTYLGMTFVGRCLVVGRRHCLVGGLEVDNLLHLNSS